MCFHPIIHFNIHCGAFIPFQNASVNHRKAILGFLTQLDVDELPLFFWLLMKPLLSNFQKDDEISSLFWHLSQSPKDEVCMSDILKYFTADTVNSLSWKKKYGFLHVVEDILAVFDESHLDPFLDLLINCVVRTLVTCTSSNASAKSDGLSCAHNSCSSAEDVYSEEGENQVMVILRIILFRLCWFIVAIFFFLRF